MATGMRALLDTVVQALPQVKLPLPSVTLTHIDPHSHRKSRLTLINTQEEGKMGGHDRCYFCWPLDDSDRWLIKGGIDVHMHTFMQRLSCFQFQLDAFRLPMKTLFQRERCRLSTLDENQDFTPLACHNVFNQSIGYIKLITRWRKNS